MAIIQKALITGFGDESKITVVQEEIRASSANEVQVEVEFSGFSGADINMRRGTYPMQKKPPFTPGYCFRPGKCKWLSKHQVSHRLQGSLSIDLWG